MSTLYERELKGILMADKQLLARTTKSCDLLTRDKMYKIENWPFIVIRAAGSFGLDLVALRGDVAFPIEVKTSIKKVIRFGGSRLAEQADEMIRECASAKVLPIYAYRLKRKQGDSWMMFTIDIDGLEGMQRLLHDRLPKLRTTKAGNYVMEWEEGMPLSQFIDYLC
jgi:Holliday junction resolvase